MKSLYNGLTDIPTRHPTPPSKISLTGIDYNLLNLGKRPPNITGCCQGQPDGKSLSLKRQFP